MRGDGASDDSEALQAALDKAAAAGNGGVVFLPSGRYRLTRTLYVWRGVRVIGYGATRPVFVLADETPGYQKGLGLMVMFTNAAHSGAPPPPGNTRVPFPPPGSVPPRDDIPDASPVTFYPAMSNIDFEIGAGNPAAVAIRFHVAQHGYPEPHGLPHRVGARGAHPDRQPGRGRALLRRALRHPDRQHVAVLALRR